MVNTNQILLNWEIANSIVEFAETLKTCFGHVNTLRVGDILDITQFDEGMLDIDIGCYDAAAEFLRGEAVESHSLHNVILVVTPSDHLLVFLEFLLIIEIESMLLEFSSGGHVLQNTIVGCLADFGIVREID